MFQNVGQKIKTVVRYATIILSVLLPVVGLLFIIIGDDLDMLGWIMIPSPLLLLIPALFAYGFGEMVDTAIYLRQDGSSAVPQPKKAAAPTAQPKQMAPTTPPTKPTLSKEPAKPATPAVDVTPYIGKKICSGCGQLISDPDVMVCPECGCKYLGAITKTNALNVIPNIVNR